MTTEQSMLDGAPAGRRAPSPALAAMAHALTAILAMAVAAALGLGGCAAKKPSLVAPMTHVAPYDPARGQVLWAIAPLRNESGTTLADPLAISDKLVAAAAQVRGVRAVPLNRTVESMRALGLTEIASPADVQQLAKAMGVDALVIGAITAYEPYDPPTLGLTLALYAQPDTRGQHGVDVESLRYRATETGAPSRSAYPTAPASVVSVHLDGKNHAVLMDVQTYAEGRHDPGAALGWRRYLASMDLFTEFAAWHAVGRLVDQEWIRLARAPAEAP